MPYIDVEYGNELEFDNMINFLKAGISTADKITTVSENYANEILYDYYGYGMQYVLNERKSDLSGIVNGIDYSTFSAKVDETKKRKHNYLKKKK